MAYRRLLACVLLLLLSSVAAAQELEGEVLMDIGFRAENDGFSFENYGNEYDPINLTPVEMVRMFGEVVCSSQVDEDGWCELTPSAQVWMEETAESMDGGHCEGMAVLSLLLYYGQVDVTALGADTTVDLGIEDNEALQREIGYWWTSQSNDPLYSSTIVGTPSEIVQTLIDGMDQELYSIGIYTSDGDGGHSITPYAVTDIGGDVYRIMVYDNNYPGEERFIDVDMAAETWVYTGSTNPSEPETEYDGDAESQTLDVTPMGPRFEIQDCDFCGDAGTWDDEDYTGVQLNGRGNLVVTDAEGNQSGMVDGTLVNNIPGAQVRRSKSGYANLRPPAIYLPAGTRFTASISQKNGAGTAATGISIIRKGSVTVLSGLTLGEVPDTLDFADETFHFAAGEGTDELTFRQGSSAQSGEDFLYAFSGSSGSLDFVFDPAAGDVQFTGDNGAAFDVDIERVAEDGTSTEYHTDDWLPADDATGFFSPSGWGDTLEIDLLDADGNVIDSESFENMPDDDIDSGGEIDGEGEIDDEGGDETDVDGTDDDENADPDDEADTGDEEIGDDTGTEDTGDDTGTDDTGGDDAGGEDDPGTGETEPEGDSEG